MKIFSFLRTGIRGKLAWMFLFATVLPLLGIGYYGYSTTAESLTENMRIANQEAAASLADNIQAFLAHVPEDLRFLQDFHALQRFLQWREVGEPYKTRDWRRDTANAFASFLNARKVYAQLQVIAPDGNELLRVKYDAQSDSVSIVADDELRDRRAQPDFQQGMTVARGEVYAGALHLDQDKDGGTLTQPVLRYAMPIFDQDGDRQGVLVLTLRAEAIFVLLQQNLAGDSAARILLADSDGQYVFHPERHLEWGKSRGHGVLLTGEFPELAAAIAAAPRQGVILSGGLLSAYRQVLPLTGAGSGWSLIKQIDSNLALQHVKDFRNVFITSVGVILALVLLLSHWFAGRLTRPLLAVRDKLQSLARGKPSSGEISYRGQDEIQEIIRSEQRLRESVVATIGQTQAVAAGNYHNEVRLLSNEDELGQALAHMTRRLREMSEQTAAQDWLKSGQAKLSGLMSGEQDVLELAQKIIRFLAVYVQAPVGAIYLVDERNPRDPVLKMVASHAFNQRKRLVNEFRLGQGVVGQAALEKEILYLRQVPEDYLVIESGLGESSPRHVLVAPFLFEGQLKGAVELAAFIPPGNNERTFLESVLPAIGIAVNTAESRRRMQELLAQTQTQSEELQAQAEELQSQTEELQTQQEELRQINEELEERTRVLERQQKDIADKNTALEKAREVVQAKAEELERASRYKSEFLANMSHELRTPLNSLLILGQLLAENKTGNLTEKQVEYARTILSAGSDLLSLINDILDLAKVESGKMQVQIEDYAIADLAAGLEAKFRHVADDKRLSFSLELGEGLPESLRTDSQRLRQVVNNLLSNAFKFTSQGGIRLSIRRPDRHLAELRELGLNPARCVAISVKDTGIGIAADKLQLVFEAFQQADGTTSRRFGGTGLGLSISRQLARLLGGDILAESVEGQGSTFTLYLPEQMPSVTRVSAEKKTTPPDEERTPLPRPAGLAEAAAVSAADIAETTQLEDLSGPRDDRQTLRPDDKSILVIEDDRNFSRILLEISREKGFKCLLAEDGRTGLQLAREYKPNAVVLDVGLPQMDGWSVMEQLKEDPETRHIPVHFISGSDHDQEARRMGAIGYLLKPVSMAEVGEAFRQIENFIARGLKNLLLVSENAERQAEISALVQDERVKVVIAADRAQAWAKLQAGGFDCVVLDLDLEGRSGLQFLEQLSNQDSLSRIPVILYADRDLSLEEERALHQLEAALTVKAVRSPERLLDETTLFLHQVEAALPKEKRNMLRRVHDKEAILAGRRVLLVDDDMRNTFALATVLEDREMEVLVAKDGKEALDILAREAHTPDVVLMDIMMPEMDGYEAIRRIRAQERFRRLPIIALTAKAMKGDKAKCIEAGANDYLSKPVDTDKLMSLMRVWLYR